MDSLHLQSENLSSIEVIKSLKTKNMKSLYKLFLLVILPCLIVGCDDSVEVVNPSLVLDKNELSFVGYQSSLIVKVDATRRWNAIATESWIGITPDSYPSANEHFIANVAVSVSDNGTGEQREGSVVFYLEDTEIARLTVKQDIQNEEERPDEKFPITWANLQWAASTAIVEGSAFEAGSCVFAAGITNVIESETGEDITCDIGYSLSNTDPSGESWTWTSCWFNGDWGNNFYYQGKIEGLTSGTYYYTFRFRNGSGQYKYAGTGGLWDGIDNVNGIFEVVSDDDEDDDRDYSGLSITWAYLQWAASTSISKGGTFEAGSQIFIDGLTNAESASATGEGVLCDIGYSMTNSNPTGEGWTWEACKFNADWGNNFYYQGKTSEIQEAGTYYYTFRFKMGKNGEYAYAGTGGLWDGIDSVSGIFEVVSDDDDDDDGDDDDDDGGDYSGLSITWANLQWAASVSISKGGTFEAGSCIFIDGLTNTESASTTGEGVLCDIGYSTTNSNPSGEGWIWEACRFNADWGNNFYYQGKTPEIQEPGTYYYAFRFKMGKNGEYAYAGTGGLWDDESNVNGTFQVSE